ncbi:MAG TPA: AAA family ATPase, partial [Burkholderiaceae bacterium]|nr:AAA family ATPase [Burkholderiaceae bacterium]
QGSAAPGSIRVGAATRDAAAAHFAFKALGRHTLKGIAEPVAVFEPLADKPGRMAASSEPAPGPDAPLVGRQHELATLSGALGRLSAGRGSLVLIRGEPGAGKTRLLAEARARHAAPGLLWLEGRSVSFGRHSSYWPFIEVLRTALDIGEGDGDAEALRKLEAAAHALFGSQAAETVPYLATLLSIDLTAEHRERVRFLDAQAMKRQVFLSVRQLFERLAHRQAVLVVLEDWHWTDRSSVALLEHLLPLAAGAALSVVLTSRLEPAESLTQIREAAGSLADLQRDEIVLAPLADADSRALIDAIMGSSELPEPVRDQVQRRTAGNPFFIEQVMRAFIADGTLVRDAHQNRWRLARPMAEVTIPGTVQAVLVARIDRLDDGAKSVLKLASVIGRVFLLRVLKAVYADTDAIEPRLQRLEEAELIQRSSDTPEAQYAFKHALVQEAAYDSMLEQQRKGIHRRVAQAIESLFAERRDEFASLLAYHCARAEDWPMAQTHLLAAGDQAGRIAADAEALEHYRQAEATFMKVAAHALTPLQLASMDRKLGQAFYGIGSYDEAVARFARALSRLDIAYPKTRVGVRLAIARHIAAHFTRSTCGRWMRQTLDIEAAQEASAVCESLAWMDYNVDEDRFALDGLIALGIGERSGDASSRIRGLATLGMVLLVMGWRRMAGQRIAQAVAAADSTCDPAALAGTLFVRGWFEWTHAVIDEGTRSLDRSAALYRSIGDLRGWAAAGSAQIWLLARRAQFARAAALAEEMVRVGESANDPHLASWGSVGLGHLCSIVGPLDRAAH